MLKLMLAGAVAGGALIAAIGAASAADPYTFALVPKNTNNPFFDQALAGCKKAESGAEGRGEVPLHRPRRARRRRRGGADRRRPHHQEGRRHRRLARQRAGDGERAARARRPPRSRSSPGTSDLLPADKGERAAYVGTHNYEIGVNIAKLVMQIKPKGGTICIQSGGAAAANHNERMQGIRDTLAGTKSKEVARRSPHRPERLEGSGRLPALHRRRLRPRQPADGGHPRQISRPRRLHADRRLPAVPAGRLREDRTKYKDKIASGKLALVVADTLPVQIDLMKKGLSAGQVGQRPFEMGYKAMYFLKDMKDGKPAPADPTYTGLDVCTPKTADTCVGGGS